MPGEFAGPCVSHCNARAILVAAGSTTSPLGMSLDCARQLTCVCIADTSQCAVRMMYTIENVCVAVAAGSAGSDGR